MRQLRWTRMIAAVVLVLARVGWSSDATAQEDDTQSRAPSIVLTQEEEDGEVLLFATVTVDDEPVEGALVTFTVVRTFGAIVLGSEETFDDGTAAVEFPSGIPGDTEGRLTIVASIEGDAETVSVSASATFKSDVLHASTQSMFPEALWSPRPLWPLIAVIAVLFAGVWSTYAFVIVQLIKLRS